MHNPAVEPFLDNWAYLKAELTWLDRLLSFAVARQRQETKEVDRVARSRADRVTSHWWKGLLNLDSEIAYDSPAEMPRRKPSSVKASFQQQMEAKIQASQRQGILLGVPSLCDRLQLTTFEKNLLVMALAPEISRRYGRIYNYLQDTEQSGASGLPTVDLVLRTLCRTDVEWRSARQLLTTSVLIQQQLVEIDPDHAASLLTRLVKLSDPLVNFLLADRPDAIALEELLTVRESSLATIPLVDRPQEKRCFTRLVEQPVQESYLQCWTPTHLSSEPPSAKAVWETLILPPSLLASLQHLCHRGQFAHQVDTLWGFAPTHSLTSEGTVGSIALLIGAAGTGKTTAAQAIAQTLGTSLFWADLALLDATDHASLVQQIIESAPTVLLLKSAQIWLGRSPMLPASSVHQFLAARQRSGITLFSTQQKQSIKPHWQQHIGQILSFPVPDAASRLRLWQQAFPPEAPVDAEIDWEWLAQQFVLTGGEIRAIAREAAFYAAESAAATITANHLIQASHLFKQRSRRSK